MNELGQFLWNYSGTTILQWEPKHEPAVQTLIARQLRQRLANSGIIVNREVQVRTTSPKSSGPSVDLEVSGTVMGSALHTQATVVCRLEVKGNWHGELLTSLASQLGESYLGRDLAVQADHGIYVTAWFPAGDEEWTLDTDRRRRARKHSREEVASHLQEQALAASTEEKRIVSFILDVPRPRPVEKVGRTVDTTAGSL